MTPDNQRVKSTSIFRFMEKRVASLFAAFVFLIGFSLPTFAQDVTFFRIGTGATSGTYFPIGTLIGSTITGPPGSRSCEDGGSCGVPGLIAAAQTTRGSVANITGVLDGSLESALAQSDVIFAAFYGTGQFQKKFTDGQSLRVIANLYPEDVHLIVRRGAGIQSIADLKGKRISIDLPGSGTRQNAINILKAYGITSDDYIPIDANSDKSLKLIRKGELDAFFFIAGYPVGAVEELADSDLVDLLPIEGEAASRIINLYEFFSKSVIPEDTYEGVASTPTLAVSTQWIVKDSMSDELAYGLAKSLWHPRNRTILDGGHEKGRLITYESSRRGVGIPIHTGALRFYKERDTENEE
ncbi:TAXI family TRAP transporter solute-binding subunit [Sneathiella sp. P13V-1]|uniref:TAXI family TRAP transporter solute-binding subunit n=1 Tax=Sneathiella sp. P13V-1 TaxID=2697366 RepID=UPI001D119893|nr:TAXI family TRAP transporter solute-binding subunit [Sneathiella sp. P13V-1]